MSQSQPDLEVKTTRKTDSILRNRLRYKSKVADLMPSTDKVNAKPAPDSDEAAEKAISAVG